MSLAAAAAPLLVLTVLIVQDHVNIPFWDQWEFAGLLAKHHREGLGFADFWAQHNEHRLLLPRLLMLALARATHWSIGAELALNVCLAVAALTVIGRQLAWTRRQIPSLNVGLLLPLLALLHLAYSQAENWLWGWQIAVFLNLLAVVSAIVVLCRPELSWRGVALGFALAAAALFSFGNGALAFGLGLLPLAHPRLKRSSKATMVALWAVGAALLVGGYLSGLSLRQTDIMSSVGNAGRNLLYALVFLGYPMAGGDIDVAVWTGSAGLACFAGLTLYLVFSKKVGFRVLLPYLCLGGYAVASAGLIALGRSDLGVGQAAATRYIVFGNLLWTADLALLFIAFAVTRARASRMARTALAVVCLAVSAGVVASSAAGLRYGERHRTRLASVRDDILTHGVEGFDLELAKRIYPQPLEIRSPLKMMKERGYSLFAGANKPRAQSSERGS